MTVMKLSGLGVAGSERRWESSDLLIGGSTLSHPRVSRVGAPSRNVFLELPCLSLSLVMAFLKIKCIPKMWFFIN